MGFDDAGMIDAALAARRRPRRVRARPRFDDQCDNLLDDLAEMVAANRDLNKVLMLKHDGNVKRTVKALVENA